MIGRDFLGTRVILYRDGTGKAVVQGAYCPHLGADLSVGEVVDGQIRCAYHHWKFDCAGRCVDIPAGDKIPPGARISTYPAPRPGGSSGPSTGRRRCSRCRGSPALKRAS